MDVKTQRNKGRRPALDNVMKLVACQLGLLLSVMFQPCHQAKAEVFCHPTVAVAGGKEKTKRLMLTMEMKSETLLH